MSRNVAPALWPAVAILTGICLAPRLVPGPMAYWWALAALGGSWGRAGRLLVCLALGVLAGLNHGQDLEQGRAAWRSDRPVELVARCTDHPRRDGDGVVLRIEVLRVRQRQVVTSWPEDIWLRVPVEEDSTESPLDVGTTLRVRGYLKRSTGYGNRVSSRPGPWRMTLKSRKLLWIESEAPAWRRVAGALHRHLDHRLQPEAGREPSDGILWARVLALGDRQGLPIRWRQGLNRAGLGHLAAVSGLHVGLVLALIWTLLWGLPRRLRLMVAMMGGGVYWLLIGPHPSILRATIMALLAVGALLLDRPPAILNALACCAVVMAIHDPSVVDQLGFQLSLSATAGLLVLAPWLEARWTPLPAWFRRSLSATLAAQLATAPFLVPLMGGWHPASPILHLLALPWLASMLWGSGLTLIVVCLWPAMSGWSFKFLDLLASPMGAFCEWPASTLWYVPWRSLPGWSGLLVGVLIVWPSVWPERSRIWRWGLPTALVICGVGWWIRMDAQRPDAGVVFLDVGQGDATLLYAGGKAILIDGGGWPRGDFGGRVLLPALAAEGIHRLDVLVMTHPDLDHCAGLVDLARYLPVGEVWSGPSWGGTCGERLLAATQAPWRVVWRGEKAQVAGWAIEILHPQAGARSERNDRSLVLKATWNQTRILLTGDIEARAEKQLLRTVPFVLSAEILKVAHHGSKTSTGRAFLKAVDPELAVISSGARNPYGHPSSVVLQRLESHRTRLLRSDIMGAVHIGLSETHPSKMLEFPGNLR